MDDEETPTDVTPVVIAPLDQRREGPTTPLTPSYGPGTGAGRRPIPVE